MIAQASVLGFSESKYEKYSAAVNIGGDPVPAPELKEVLLTIAGDLNNPSVGST